MFDLRPRLLLISALVVLLGGCSEPFGPFAGGRLDGPVADAPFADWELAATLDTVLLETNPEDPYSVQVWCVAHQDVLYVPSSLISGNKDPQQRRWVRNVLENPAVRVKIGATIYPHYAIRVMPAERESELVQAFQAKYAEEFPAIDAHASRAWIFQLVPRSG